MDSWGIPENIMEFYVLLKSFDGFFPRAGFFCLLLLLFPFSDDLNDLWKARSTPPLLLVSEWALSKAAWFYNVR